MVLRGVQHGWPARPLRAGQPAEEQADSACLLLRAATQAGQGRATDLSAIKGENDGAGFTRSVLKHWGELPRSAGVKVRISPSADPLGQRLFTTVFRFGTFEGEGEGEG
ncbi:hypothetical protein [Streptomyces coeruleorubidus]|uniref:hypothetical protein n=1 Tax=Streptomyces coeruleorubidus TaxID=116188 RepID=UPI0036AA9F7E